MRRISPNTLSLTWHPHRCPVCHQTWGHNIRHCAEPEESLCNSCLIYPVLAPTNPGINELRIRIELPERVAEAALAMWKLFCDSQRHELLALAARLDEAVNSALCNLEAALSAADYDQADEVFARWKGTLRKDGQRQLQEQSEEKEERT